MKNIVRLDWSLCVECPSCKKDNDLADGNHDTENDIAIAIFNNKWGDLKGYEIICDNCDLVFKIDKVEY